MYTVEKYLVGLRDKSRVFGYDKIVDDFGYNTLHHLMKKKLDV